MALHSSTLAWKIPWTEEPGGLQSMGSLRVGHDWATSLSLFTFMHRRRKWQPTPVFLPGESQGRGSLVGCRLWVVQSRTRLKWLSSSRGSNGKESACNEGDPGLIPGSEWSLEKEMTTHFSILAWRIQWTEEPGRLQSMRSQRVRQDWVTNTFTYKLTIHFDETSQTKTIWMKSDKLTIVYLLDQLLSHIWPFATPWTVARQVPLWSVFPFPSPEDFPDPWVESMSPALADGFFTIEPPGKPMFTYVHGWSHHFTNYNISYHI